MKTLRCGPRISFPTDTLALPEKDEVRPIQDLISEALANRPDLGQARLQIENSQIGLEGARSATRPEVDLVGVMQNNGLAGTVNPFALPNPGFAGGYGTVLDQVLARKYPTYGIGLQMTLPVHNRIAEADLARDELQVKQSQIRLRQFENQARLEVEDALIAMGRARSSYEAAVEARKLQEESLAAEQAKFEVGASTSFFVIQYESLLAQARSTEVAGHELVCEGASRAGAGHRDHPGRPPDLAGRRRQGQVTPEYLKRDAGQDRFCFGASPVAAVFGSAPGARLPRNIEIHFNPAPPAALS